MCTNWSPWATAIFNRDRVFPRSSLISHPQDFRLCRGIYAPTMGSFVDHLSQLNTHPSLIDANFLICGIRVIRGQSLPLLQQVPCQSSSRFQ